jgi:hypothetical protein
VAHVGLLADLAGMTHSETACALGTSPALVGRQLTRHRSLLRDEAYAPRTGNLGVECHSHVHGADGVLRPPR